MDLSSRLGFALVSLSDSRGTPSMRESSFRAESVPALCTHRPSLLPIGLCGEHAGPAASIVALGKICQSWCLEEGEVVTRFL